MKYCINCGISIPDIAKFCGKCGAAQNVEQTVCEQPAALQEQVPAYVQPPQPTTSHESVQTAVQAPKSMPIATIQSPAVRQKLMPYFVFTVIVQLAIIVLMFFNFGVIKVNNTVRGDYGQTVIREGNYGVSVFDLLHFEDTLKEISPGFEHASETNYAGMAWFLFIPLIFLIIYFFYFVIVNLTRPAKYSSAYFVVLVWYFLFSILILNIIRDEITDSLARRYFVSTGNYYLNAVGLSEMRESLLKYFSWRLSWESILIMVLAVAQLAANIAMRGIVINKNDSGIVAKINKIADKYGRRIVGLLMVLMFASAIIIPYFGIIPMVIFCIVVVLLFVGSFVWDYLKGKKR